MVNYFGDTSGYDHPFLKLSDSERLAQSTSHLNAQRSHLAHPQNGAESEFNYFNKHTWMHESALPIPERLYSAENEMHLQSAHHLGYSDKPVNQSFPSWTPTNAQLMSEHFGSLSLALTPESLYTPSSVGSADDLCDIFDLQFGDALDYSSISDPERSFKQSHYTYLESLDSSCSSGTASPILDMQEYIKSSRLSPTRTPSPPNSESGSCPSDHRRRFPCLLAGCSRRLTSQYTLRVHMEAHKPKPKVSLPCTEGCSERFSRQHDRLRHEVSKHGKVCEFSCEECGRFFSSSKTLSNHKCPLAQLGGTRWVYS